MHWVVPSMNDPHHNILEVTRGLAALSDGRGSSHDLTSFRYCSTHQHQSSNATNQTSTTIAGILAETDSFDCLPHDAHPNYNLCGQARSLRRASY